MFEPFFTTPHSEGGSGLGLHVVQNVVSEVLSGSVELESAPGRGTTITFSFPAAARA